MKTHSQRIIRFEALPARIRRQANRAGRRDGRAGLPSGEPQPNTPLPGADAVALRWDAAIAVLDREYREKLRGLLPVLRRDVPDPVTSPDPTGPAARAARASRSAQDAARASRDSAADEVLLLTEATRASILEVDSVRRQALAVYSVSLMRHHPAGQELSARGWQPGTTPLPAWVGRPGPELLHAIQLNGYTALDS